MRSATRVITHITGQRPPTSQVDAGNRYWGHAIDTSSIDISNLTTANRCIIELYIGNATREWQAVAPHTNLKVHCDIIDSGKGNATIQSHSKEKQTTGVTIEDCDIFAATA